jgi:kinesin family protein C1
VNSSYGQTGSGKTYTMEGSPEAIQNENFERMGIIPRAVHQIFAIAKDSESKGWKYEIQISFLEIYNESIHDLLNDTNLNKKYEIKHNLQTNSTTVTDLITGKTI